MTRTTDIITSAAHMKKPTKMHIVHLLRDLMEQDATEFNDLQLAELFSFFMPPVPAAAKTPAQWVAKAAAKDDVRYYLNNVYSTGTTLIATNGHHMHWIETDEYAEGYYLPNTLDAVNVDAKYPNTDRVIPKRVASERHRIALEDLEVKQVSWQVEGKETLLTSYVLPNGTTVQKNYLDAAFNREYDMFAWLPKEKNSTIRLQSIDGVRNAVIMPVRS